MTLAQRLRSAPILHDAAMAERALRELRLRAVHADAAAELAALLDAPSPALDLVTGIFGSSPYLSRLILAKPDELWRILQSEPEDYLRQSAETLAVEMATVVRHDEAMKPLREAKRRLALATALADLGGVWDVSRITAALTDGADELLRAAIRFLLNEAARRGKFIRADPDAPETGSGYIVIGMGKYGACELNYSSDIDIIVFYEPEIAPLAPGVEPSPFFVRLTRDLVKLMTERTPDGYVFRTDLRLRPDPGATHVALSVNAALHYYETVGQNWERAAYIKARAVAGDMAAGHGFLRQLSPYVWRKYLDYAAIADIHAMKRQIQAHKGHAQIAVEGHNLKLGRGGIREIEFFVQTQQLIAGGRHVELRVRGTLEALDLLAQHHWITRQTADELATAYKFLRGIEHRLQMVEDEQTHSLPSNPDKFEQIAHLSAYPSGEALAKAVRKQLETVQTHYAALFEHVPALSRTGAPGNLVFTGDSDDPATVETLSDMGFASPATVTNTVRGWHFGRYPAVRTARARETLTEFQPKLLEALARTAQPDLALANFDRFLAELPAGVQLFAMLRNNPALLEVLADIMGTAPRLSRQISRRPRLVDAVLDPGFLGELPGPGELAAIVRRHLEASVSYEDCLDRARTIGQEQAFLIGVRIISGDVGPEQAGQAYAALADQLIIGLHAQVQTQIERQHGRVRGGEMAVIGMGKLGGREMTATSDLDLIMIYRYEQGQDFSDGAKPVATTQYYARVTQRLISALSAPTAEGGLYAVDMRLRPSGKSGPVATSLPSFVAYQQGDAWTWEHMALTRARVISGPPALREAIESTIRGVLCRPRDRARIAADVRDMRARIEQEKGSKDVWDTKYAVGGLIDVEFIAQFLQLVNAHEHPDILDQSTAGALEKLRAAGLLAAADAELLLPAAKLYHGLTQIIRLCQDGRFDPAKAPPGLKAMLSRAADVPDFSRIEPLLKETHAAVARCFERLIK
ncbi:MULTISPECIES: bifunctional [glutamine synthetase] adenylyltransferase/[glutamine synthetase]-adenylyl-L-tyrosine phosphorylase [Rhodomicrobium]|uniref:bifunctional [glutamine synthetase] adenylyltransferase/[glutamine synthetase]-adenylyl-L-tyrosine phosphorylase n=1 Tax=Rhodomicrobium TaxID=1068 RepID=UPI000B4BBE1B|nr:MULTISPECIES: bifunctional [glutamine synthetase] adenylyltransferase/[glutamine synthetase]-adenylyl-L-tyrosine phosphorylase [Rhodomicrobium]